MTPYQTLQESLRSTPQRWLITGAAGFIGSNLLEALLRLDQTVFGLDNFSTGYKRNLSQVQALVTQQQWARFHFVDGDVSDPRMCLKACDGVDYVLHQAALGSVPQSIAEPLTAHRSNATGFINVLDAARHHKAKRFVYASSSAVYGDNEDMPKVENRIGQALSPYAANKFINELYAGVFARCYGVKSIGLRYFNVFGPRQDPEGAYAAVIPKWIDALIRDRPVIINGDGETSRDFCFIDNVVQANLLAACVQDSGADNRVYNVAMGHRTTLNELYEALVERLEKEFPQVAARKPVYADFRAGDIRHSQADIGQAQMLLKYTPTHSLQDGLDAALEWYKKNVV